MRVVVSGGSGFIGSWVAEALVARGDDVLNVDDMSGGDNVVDGAKFLHLNLATDDLSAVTAFDPKVVFHAAACAREGASQFQPRYVTASGPMASAALFSAAIKAKSLKRIVFCSSMARYGDQEPPFGEGLVPQPVDVYGHGKVFVEGMLRALAHVHGFDWSILVPHNVIGARQTLRDRFRNVAAITMNRIMLGLPITVFGDGKQQRAFSAVEDNLPCFLRAIDGHGARLPINVGGSTPITVNDLVNAIKDDMGVPNYPTRHLPDRPLEVKNAWCEVTRSVEVLGYEEKVGWRECVRNMARWAQSVGPQPWRVESLELFSKGMPEVWQ